MQIIAKIILSFLLLVAPSYAQELSDMPDAGVNNKNSALGARQQRVKRLMLELERKFSELSSKLEADQPEQAKKITDAFQRSKELIMEQRMDKVTGLLNSQKLESASEEQGKIVDDIENIISILLNEEDELEKMKEKIKDLEAMKEKIAEMIEKERDLKEDVATLVDKDGKLDELNEQIRQVEELIKKQKALKEKTREESVKGIDKVEKLAPEQAELRSETEKLGQQIAGESREEIDSDDKPKEASKPGAQAMREAAREQAKAEGELSAGQGAEAEKSEDDSIEDLERALEELKEERERIAAIDPKEKLQELAQEQDETANESGKLAEEMERGEGEPKDGEEPPEQEPSTEEKAVEAMKSAKKEMKKASQKLVEKKPKEAEEDQEEAIEDLEEALEQITKEAEKMKESIQEQVLAQLEAIFIEMLERQKKITKSTADLDHQRKQAGEDKLARAQRVQLRSLSRDEKLLAQAAGEAENLLLEDGTSVVVLSVVTELKNGLLDLGALMDDSKTGELVKSSQKEIELTLEELITAMEKAQDQKQEEPGKDKKRKKGKSSPPQLVSPAVELRMLKFSQLQVNRRAVDFHNARLEVGTLDDKVLGQVEELAAFQEKITAMARKMSGVVEAQSP